MVRAGPPRSCIGAETSKRTTSEQVRGFFAKELPRDTALTSVLFALVLHFSRLHRTSRRRPGGAIIGKMRMHHAPLRFLRARFSASLHGFVPCNEQGRGPKERGGAWYECIVA